MVKYEIQDPIIKKKKHKLRCHGKRNWKEKEGKERIGPWEHTLSHAN
jgi:hypothetical protein